MLTNSHAYEQRSDVLKSSLVIQSSSPPCSGEALVCRLTIPTNWIV